MPNIGTVPTWIRNPPMPIKFGVKRRRDLSAIDCANDQAHAAKAAVKKKTAPVV